MEAKNYHIFWYDVYSSGYRRGASHAVDETGTSLCGRNFKGEIGSTPVDGGYHNCEEQTPDCKTCKKKLGYKENDVKKDGYLYTVG